nr:MAG TPA: hypothetical protein [Caudoviricetes sp.]
MNKLKKQKISEVFCELLFSSFLYFLFSDYSFDFLVHFFEKYSFNSLL